ncbi:MAG: hypothetical protein IIA66_05570 [Planctomycetes bacterium]|nr:hypothetical protein [Planctomycetota bacterium]
MPEVQTIVTTLQPLVGRCVGSVRVLRGDVVRGEPVDFGKFAKGRKIRAIRRQAKRIIFDLGGERRIQFHLGMTGQLTVCKRSHPLQKHTHLRIGIAGTKDELRFRDVRRFGGVWLLNDWQVDDQGAASFSLRESSQGENDTLAGRSRRLKPAAPWDSRGLGPLGPDALEITLRKFRRLLRRNRQVKALLLDQAAIGGLGNIYVDESLYKARVHPLTRAAELGGEQVRKLHGAMRRTLRWADSGTTYVYYADIHLINASGHEVATFFDWDTTPESDYTTWTEGRTTATIDYTLISIGPATLDVPFTSVVKAGRFDSGVYRTDVNQTQSGFIPERTAGELQSVLQYATGADNKEGAVLVI